MEETKLTAKQRLFCYYYPREMNATRAAILAGYSEKTARAIGQENLTKPVIQKEISRIQADVEGAARVSLIKVLAEQMKLAFTSIAHFHNTWTERKEFERLTDDEKSCIQEIATKTITEIRDKEPVEVEYVKVRLYDKQKALDSIVKMLGYDAPQKLQHSMNGETLGRISFLMDRFLEAKRSE